MPCLIVDLRGPERCQDWENSTTLQFRVVLYTLMGQVLSDMKIANNTNTLTFCDF